MTSKLTREQLHERARENVKTLKMASRQTAFESAREEILADLQLAELALAAMDSEPVQNHIGSKNSLDAIVSFIKSKSNPTVKCYEEVSEQLFKDNCHGIHSHVIEYILKLGEELEDLRAEQDEVQPAPEYPETLPCPVLLEPGLRFGKGIKTSTMLAALARRAVYESDVAALSPEERAEFQARIEDFKALIAQPAPVVPDERDKAVDADDHPLLWSFNAGWNACRAAMLSGGKS